VRVHRLEKAKIQATKPQETSLMPELLVNRLTDQALRDLLAFLEEVGAKPEKK
jgi:cytochrome c1